MEDPQRPPHAPGPMPDCQPGKIIWGLECKWWVLIAIGVGTFMSALDGSIVNTVLPVINRAFNTQFVTIQWVVTVYLLVISGFLLTFGRLGDLYGHKRAFTAGFLLFVLSSMACGVAPHPIWLIVFRGVQALGAAMLSANSPAILTRNFPTTQRGQALGLQATMTYLGLTVGPPLGGWLAAQFGWRYVFYINVPVGALALWLTWHMVPQDTPTGRHEPFDLAGAGVFLAGLVLLLLGLNRGSGWGWGSPAIVGLLVSAIALLGLFIWIERRSASPMLDLSLFRQRVFSAAAASAMLNYICVSGALFLLPFYLIQGRGFSSAEAGRVLIAQAIVMAITAPLSGTLSDRIGSRTLATVGMLILAGGLVILSRVGAQAPLGQVILGLAVTGLGTGVFISPNTSALMGAAPRTRQGVASGVLATVRTVGQTLGAGLAGAIFATALAQEAPGGSSEAIYAAVRLAFIITAGVAVLAAAVSAVRGEGVKQNG